MRDASDIELFWRLLVTLAAASIGNLVVSHMTTLGGRSRTSSTLWSWRNSTASPVFLAVVAEAGVDATLARLGTAEVQRTALLALGINTTLWGVGPTEDVRSDIVERIVDVRCGKGECSIVAEVAL